MKIYFIRHAHALDRSKFEGDDLLRPLTIEGIERAEKAFKRFISLYKKPDLIVTSTAERGKRTAEILQKFSKCDLLEDSLLNPGAKISDYEEIVKRYEDKSEKIIALVGHEPDMTKYISSYLAEDELHLVMKKGSICIVENRILIGLIQQKVLL